MKKLLLLSILPILSLAACQESNYALLKPEDTLIVFVDESIHYFTCQSNFARYYSPITDGRSVVDGVIKYSYRTDYGYSSAKIKVVMSNKQEKYTYTFEGTQVSWIVGTVKK